MKQVQATIGSLCVAWLALGIGFGSIPVFAAGSAAAGQKEKPVAEETFDVFGADANKIEERPRKFPNAALQQRIDSTAFRTYDSGDLDSITNLVQAMIQQGVDLNSQSTWGNSILEMAIVRGDLASVKMLLDHDVKIVEKGRSDYTSLRAAAHMGQKEVADFLISKGAKLDIFSASALGLVEEVKKIIEKDPAAVNARLRSDGPTPLMWTVHADVSYDSYAKNKDRFAAFWLGRLEVAALLVKKGADVNAISGEDCALLGASDSRGKYRFVELLLANGANANVTNRSNCTPLLLAIHSQDVLKVKLLLDHGADVNAIGITGDTPLHRAMSTQNTNLVALLLAKGADTNLKNKAGQTPLDIARKAGNGRVIAEIYAAYGIKAAKELPSANDICKVMKSSDPQKWDEVKAMVEGNPKAINAKPSESISYNTPFRDAIQFRDAPISIIELMIAKGVDINSGLSYAIYSGRKEVFDLLLKHGAVVNADNGDSLLVAACQSGSKDAKDLVELLLEKGVSANGKDGDKYPPLATAIFYGLNSDIARVLIDHDANVNRKVGAFMPDEKDGQSLLELARHQAAKHNNSGTQGIVDLLIQAGAKDEPGTSETTAGKPGDAVQPAEATGQIPIRSPARMKKFWQ